MKRLIMVRHAKSDWGDLTLKDFDRPLNKRGKENAPDMGNRLKNRHYYVDTIISSSSKRTKQTSKRVADAMGFDKDKIIWEDGLYHANSSKIREFIYTIDSDIESVMIVCHNTGITDFVNSLCGYVTDNLPTCGMVAFEIDCKKWKKFDEADKKLVFFDYPRSRD